MELLRKSLHRQVLIHVMAVHMLHRLLNKGLGLIASHLLNDNLHFLANLLHPLRKFCQTELLYLLVHILFLRKNQSGIHLIGQKELMHIGHQIH